MNKLYIEARVNEYTMRKENPKIPYTPDELVRDAVACRKAGATIMHYHARTATGEPDNSLETNKEIIRRIRDKTDILLHPTLGFISNDADPRKRIDQIAEMCVNPETRPDIVPIDMGSMNYELYDEKTGTFQFTERIYHNTTEAVMYAAKVFSQLGLGVQIVCWNVGFVRRAKIIMDMGLLKEPGFFFLCTTTGELITGHPPTPTNIDAMVEMLPQDKNITWCVDCAGGSLLEVLPYVVRSGGNISLGLGDHPYMELGTPDNAAIISRAVAMAERCGRELATIEEAKAMLGIS